MLRYSCFVPCAKRSTVYLLGGIFFIITHNSESKRVDLIKIRVIITILKEGSLMKKELKKKQSLYLTDDLKSEVVTLAKATDRTFNGMVVVMIKEYLERNK